MKGGKHRTKTRQLEIVHVDTELPVSGREKKTPQAFEAFEQIVKKVNQPINLQYLRKQCGNHIKATAHCFLRTA